MPYCPKCDMEFVDGITICSDCGGPLVASKEVADAMKRQEQEQAAAAYARMLEETGGGETPGESDAAEAARQSQAARRPAHPRVYIKKSQQYDDFKSSASAFFLVGGIALAFSVLGWSGIIPLPMAGISRLLFLGVITLMAAVCLAVAVSSSRCAKAVSGQIGEEEETTRRLVGWFVESYSGEALDAQILRDYEDLSPEELSLKRFDLIRDLIITSHDIADEDYVDLLSEEIYTRLYEP